MEKPPYKRNAARCKLCDDVIESKHDHDFVYCKCKAIFVDGGLWYVRRGGKLDQMEDLSELTDEAKTENVVEE
jgi:hypothetical protein